MPDEQIVKVVLHKVHLELLEPMVPFFGDDIGEVVRYIVIDWLANEDS